MLFGLRFDFRNPELAGTAMADRYAAALDMAAWADDLGCVSIAVSEHHSSPDGYLPSPVPMLAAMSARTSSVRFTIAALIAPFHHPLRLAEDLIVLDMMMPKKSGFLVLEKLKGRPGGLILTIMITGNEGSRHRAYAEMLGVRDYIRKPFAMEKLVKSVEQILEVKSHDD